jgi:GH15 family glucan-1,4-alpha-glucosidase
MNESSYPPISDYAYIADCHSTALVSRSASIDWCCMPRVDSGSCFGRLLDWRKGGFCQITPQRPFEVSRRYIDGTLVLEMVFATEEGRIRLTDCFTMRQGGSKTPFQQILRIVDGISGSMEISLDISPSFDYGTIRPWIRPYHHKHFIALGGSQGLLISGDFGLSIQQRYHLVGSSTVEEGRRLRLSIIHYPPEELDNGYHEPPDSEELDQRLDSTIEWWRRWSQQASYKGPYADQALRSAIILKGLTIAPTGAITAAATTSLPEAPGGTRNWDYRYTWIRDSSFAVRALTGLGFENESYGFRRFVERTAAGSVDELQIMFGVGGERRLHEFELGELEGYRGAKPVRVGNAAEKQIQLDVFGELLDPVWHWHRRGRSPHPEYWDFLTQLVDAASVLWRKPDCGIWEMRGSPRHFVQSKVMCWAALNRGIHLAEELGQAAPLDKWRKAREEVRRAIEQKGYDAARGVYIQAFERVEPDASLLLIPTVGYIDYQDERMIRTTDFVWQQLDDDGLLRRYRHGNDELEGREGVFLACSFWLVDCLSRQHRLEEARRVFERALSTGNDLGLFAEEYDPRQSRMLGNFPQALTHLSLITAILGMAERVPAAWSYGR